MEVLFLKLVNMSINATWLIAVVAMLRLVLSKAPKQLRCTLWGLVALRLVLPVSIESIFSLLPSPQTLPDNIIYTARPVINSGIPLVDDAVNPVLSGSLAPDPLTSANPTQILSFVCSQIWILGMVLMLLYALLSWLHIRRKVAASIPAGKDIRLCDYIDSPFILGIIQPVIYLPSHLEQISFVHVVAHERAHLQRRDHWWKPLGFVLLSVHWFNPAVWIAYCLLCRDIEFACDERVIRELDDAEKQAYSHALLHCSIRRPYLAACPLAFGEVGVRQRIRSVLNYRRPGFWILLAAAILSSAAVVCFFTDPVRNEYTLEGTTIHYETDDTGRITCISHQEEDVVYTLLGRTTYPHGAVSNPYRLFPNGEIRDGDGQPVNILYFVIQGLRRETGTRLMDSWQYNMSNRTFAMDPDSDSLDRFSLCRFPEIPRDNNLAALAGFSEEEICTVSLSSRIGIISLSSRDSMVEFVDFLSDFRYDPTPLSDKPVSEEYIWGGSVTAVAPVNRKSHYLEESLNFSEDFRVVWTSYDGENSQPHAVINPEGLQEYFTRRTLPVKNDSVSAAPFATQEEPALWLRNVHSDALKEIYVSYDGELYGRMTAEYYAQLEEILHSIPASALTFQDGPVFFSESLHGNNALSLSFYDGANNMLVKLHWGNADLLLVTYPNADQHAAYYAGEAMVWHVDSPELARLMEYFSQNDITVTLFAQQPAQ